jgi:hypothetical protein
MTPGSGRRGFALRKILLSGRAVIENVAHDMTVDNIGHHQQRETCTFTLGAMFHGVPEMPSTVQQRMLISIPAPSPEDIACRGEGDWLEAGGTPANRHPSNVATMRVGRDACTWMMPSR